MIRRGSSVGILVLALVIGLGDSVRGQGPSDRVWLAGRYDRTRVVVYFEAVHFNGKFPRARRITAPAADVMFPPMAVSATSLTSVQKDPKLERFAIGDRYDLLLDAGRVATITLTTLVAAEGDEATGNDSYIGALGTVAPENLPFFTQKYYAVRPHGTTQSAAAPQADGPTTFAGLRNRPVLQTTTRQIIEAIRERFKGDVSPQDHPDNERLQPSVERFQTFTLSGGGQRYFATLARRSPTGCTVFTALLTTSPLRILTAERDSCYPEHEAEPPRLLAVIEIGQGRTGLVVDFPGFDGRSLQLLEYADGKTFDQMPTLWTVSAAE